MNFWHMQLHPNDLGWNREIEVLQNFNIIGLGDWKEQVSQQFDFENKMKIGDIVAIKKGGLFIALVKVVGNYEYNNAPGETDWFKRRRKVEILDWYKDEYDLYVSSRGTLTRCNTDNTDAISNRSITKWYKMTLNNQLLNTSIKLLENKCQIILQGPPGTGKTRLAEIIAKELIKPTSIDNPLELIDNYIRNFDSNNEVIKKSREQRNKLLLNFQEKFPKENLVNLSFEDYCAGRGDRNNFCWWIETGLKSLGKYFPGSARSYLIYWSKAEEEYKKHGKLIKDIEDDNTALEKVLEKISLVVNNKSPDLGTEYLGDSLLIKILNSYYPNEYFPINGREALDNVLKLFGIDGRSLSKIDKNKKLNELFLDKKKQLNSQIDPFEFMYFLFGNFNLNSKEEIKLNQKIVTEGEYEIIQFHPSYSYEDFVRGIVAYAGEKGIEYKTENKILADFARKALDNPSAKYVLVIDEINRANLPSVLGELIYALEYRGKEVQSMYEFENEKALILPRNLFIIGTMNTADRSVGHIDYAIRRRFSFVEVLPDINVIAYEFGKNLFNQIESIFLNHTSPDFLLKDIQIGHSYFLTEDLETLKMKLTYEIKPILNEYIKDGLLLDSAKNEIEYLDV